MKAAIFKIAILLFGIFSAVSLFFVNISFCEDYRISEPASVKEYVKNGLILVNGPKCYSRTLFTDLKPVSYLAISSAALTLVAAFLKSKKAQLFLNIIALISVLLIIVNFIISAANGNYNHYTLSWNVWDLDRTYPLAIVCFLIYSILLIINIFKISKKTKTKNTRK